MAILGYFERKTRILLGAAIVATLASVVLVVSGGAPVVTFGATAIALAVLASLVGEGTEQLGARQGPAVTGILQSALGNLPELFIAFFSLQAGLVVVVQFALIGSILANSLLVLGTAFVVGGLKFGTQKLGTHASRSIATLLLAVGSLVIPTLATEASAPDAGHAAELSVVVSIVLLVVFAGSLVFSIRGDSRPVAASAAEAVVSAEDPATSGRNGLPSSSSPGRRSRRRSSPTGSWRRSARRWQPWGCRRRSWSSQSPATQWRTWWASRPPRATRPSRA